MQGGTQMGKNKGKWVTHSTQMVDKVQLHSGLENTPTGQKWHISKYK